MQKDTSMLSIRNISVNATMYFLILLHFLVVVCVHAQSDSDYNPDVDDNTNMEATGDDKTSPIPEFRVYENNNAQVGLPCVLVKMEAAITIEPKRQINKKQTVNLPMAASAKGNCGNGFDSSINLHWSSFLFNWHFQKSRVSDAWYVDSIALTFNTSDKVLGDLFAGSATNAINPSSIVSIRTEDPLTLFLTPIGRSFSCTFPADIKMLDLNKISRVTIQLKNVRIQPFASMTQRQFGDAFRCPSEAGRRDDTVPLAVGLTLALVVLCTVGTYAGYRYFKIKKIEYDTME